MSDFGTALMGLRDAIVQALEPILEPVCQWLERWLR